MRGNGCLGKKEERFRKMDPRLLKITMTAMQNQKTATQAVAKRLGIATPTLYMYLNANEPFKEADSSYF
ncbi:MAG: helix-turn-helix domain-containing protein [Candidatus Paracaedibacteraceae bacterium]|nr:helix-turn-helix domain-containing protein [Candidatus Paracaedibacteraceae bacterium]